jgi:hypothetical protein
MMSAAPAPIGRCGRAIASINADEIESKLGSPSGHVGELPASGLHGKTFMARARLDHSKFRDEHAVEFMARSCLDERQAERSPRSDRPRLLPNLVRNRP